MSSDWASVLEPGMAPPSLLRIRAVQPADEVLILSYTADLRLFEQVSLAEARASGARVTVVHDAALDLVPAEELFFAGTHYTDVPVRCRSGGEFHPKLLVVAGHDKALVAIGSGNATASGWHHNAELWTTVAADAAHWPDTFHALGDWLEQLPEALVIDQFGASRVAAVAGALRGHPATTTGPELLHNLHASLLSQLPTPAAPVTRLLVASPFLDDRCEALTQVTAHTEAESTTYAMTRNAQADAQALSRWASQTASTVASIDDSRYFHGKLVQWDDVEGRHALVGSANTTAAAMLRTTHQHYGNCELALLLHPGDDLSPALGASLQDADEIAEHLTALRPPSVRDPLAPRLLRVLTDGDRVTVTLVGVQGQGAELLTDEQRLPLGDLAATGAPVRELTTHGELPFGCLCWVELADGSQLGPVRATDLHAVTARPGQGSPLDDASLGRVLSNARLSDSLFQALAALAEIRPLDDPTGGRGATSDGQWRRAAECGVGLKLVTLALGSRRAASGDEEIASGVLDPGDAVSETDEDDDAGAPADWDDLTDWNGDDAQPVTGSDDGGEGEAEVDDGVFDPLDPLNDPVSALRADPVSAQSLARAIERRSTDLEQWSQPAVLALLRVTLIVAAGGGWERQEAPFAIQAVLDHLSPTQHTDADVEAARQAAALVALGAMRAGVEVWDESTDLAASAFSAAQARLSVDPSSVDAARVAHFAADLQIGYGQTMTAEALTDAADFLLASSPLQRLAESLEDDYSRVSLPCPRLVEVTLAKASGDAPLLRLLTRLAQHAPVAARVITPTGETYAAWRPKELLIHRAPLHTTSSGASYRLSVGPGAYVQQPLPRPERRWSDLPHDLAVALAEAGLREAPAAARSAEEADHPA